MNRIFAGSITIGLVCGGACIAARSPSLEGSVDSGPVSQEASTSTKRDAGEMELDASVSCVHPLVSEDCTNGWCTIPAGCFWSGSPETEFGRGLNSEPLVPITLTHPFMIQRYETTIAEWKAVGFNDASGQPAKPYIAVCKDSDCPATNLSWMEALAYANAKSDVEGLPRCYELLNCTGKPGEGLECQSFKLTTAVSYDCKGYRLPMGAEREYATRAGTRTAFYSGDITRQLDTASCFPDQNLEKLAWYCNNSGNTTHPVGQKVPNAWGLFDMGGNVAEFVVDHDRGSGYGDVPKTDPGDPVRDFPTRSARGGMATGWPAALRSASTVYPLGTNDRDDGIGVRLVRTLFARDAGAPMQDASRD